MTRILPPARASVSALLALILVLAVSLIVATPAHARPEKDRGRHPARIVWPGYGVQVWRASGQLHRLASTSPGFRALVRHRLDAMFHGYLDSDRACAQAPLVQVKEFRRSGFAFISDEGTFTSGPGHPPQRCAGGGATRFYVRVDGTWRAPRALGSQEAYSCRVLRRFDIPRMNGAYDCYDRHGRLVAYHR